jgi:hypothetical protein
MAAKVRLTGATSGYVEIASPDAAGSNTITLPTSNGSANQLLKNSGTAGTLSFANIVEDSIGEVGIGTTNPTEVLHIVGNFNASGIVTGGIVATTTQMAGVTTTGVSTSGNSAITLAGTNVTINNGDFVIGSGIAPGTTVTSGGGTVNLVLSATVGLTTASNQITTYPAGKVVTPGVIGGQLCRAWVNFDGVNAGKIRAAYNVSSITKNGTGDYTVNFTNALTDANYAVAAMSQRGDGAAFGNHGFFAIQGTSSNTLSPTASSIRLNTMNSVGSALDHTAVFVSIFR